MKSRTSFIKKAQKESLLLREISQLYQRAAMDDPRLQQASISRVKLSKDKSVCTVYFYTDSFQEFTDLLPIITLYKPSLRKALASTLQTRYVPDIVFAYDQEYEKKMRLESLFEDIKDKGSEQNTQENSDDNQE